MSLKKYFLFFIAALYCVEIGAIPVRHARTTFTQPDGTTVTVCHYGDEWMHWSATPDGAAVIRDADGYLCYARFDADGYRYSTGVHVGPGADAAVVSEARRIPFDAVRYRAAARRALQPYTVARPNIIRRLNALHPMTKAGGTPIQKHGIIILAQFNGTGTYEKFRPANTKAKFEEMIHGSGSSTALAYFNDQFGGAYEFHFDVFGPVTLPNNCKYYGENDRAGNDKRPEEMIIDACDALDATVDFSQYDDDGDGEIDNVFVFFAGKDEADDSDSNADCIWSHQWYVRDGAGQTRLYDDKLLNNYACTSELMRSMSTGTYVMASIGTFCHEYTHTFGVPDFYDSNYKGTGGVADAWWQSFGLMCAANINNDGHTPPNYNAVERMELGLGEPQALVPGDYTMTPLQNSGVFYRIDSDDPAEYYLVECRNQSGWDQYLPGAGLLIYHVDKSTRPTGVDDDGKSCTAIERWESLNLVNAWPDHQCADLVEADVSIVGLYASLSQSGSLSALRDKESHAFWPYGSVNAFSAATSPKLSFWGGAISRLVLEDITRSGENVTFKVTGDPGYVVAPEVRNIVKNVFQDAVLLTWECADAQMAEPGYYQLGSNGQFSGEQAVEPYENGKYAVWIEGLTPSTAYQVKLYFKEEGTMGKVDSSMKWTTSSHKKSALPYIWLDSAARTSDGQFVAGSKLPLRVWNATGATSVKWFFDGTPVSTGKDGWYEVKRSGVLSAEVVREDGSTDVVCKKIVVL